VNNNFLSDQMSRYIPPSPFHTFEPLRNDPIELIPMIQTSMAGDHTYLKSLEGLPKSIQELKEGEAPDFDAAMMLFLTALEWKSNDSLPEPLDKGISRERLGRFPIEGGDAIDYLHEYTNDKGNGELHELLAKLNSGLKEEFLGENGYSRGRGGLELCGWLNVKEVKTLRRAIQKGKWSVDPGEPIDGGVSDAFRHLIIILRAAEKRRCGLLMRRHA